MLSAIRYIHSQSLIWQDLLCAGVQDICLDVSVSNLADTM